MLNGLWNCRTNILQSMKFVVPLAGATIVIGLASDRMVRQLVSMPRVEHPNTVCHFIDFSRETIPFEATAHTSALPKTPTTTGGNK